jgi:hypothetical protein
LRKILFAALIVVLVAVPIASVNQVFASTSSLIAPPLHSQTTKKAVILSSLDHVYPLGLYNYTMTYYLKQAGYQVTTLANTQVTIDFLLTQMNNYNIVIWFTNTYVWKHIEYWYVGEVANTGTETKYESDFASGAINGNAGILGVNLAFFREHFTPGLLNNVKLAMLVSSDSVSFGPLFITAGATSVVLCNGAIDLVFGEMSDMTNQILASLASGQSVYSAVYNLVSPNPQSQILEDPLDSNYTPPFWFLGDGTLVIT